jgi:D-alanyl-D-alanine carboxypeptidase/D-alanyl-D-alanine-endopeptidase (penicillin-binding protein 4)
LYCTQNFTRRFNAIKTVGDSVIRPISVKRQRGSNKIHLDGEIPFGHAEVDEYATIENPTLFFITVLKEVLEDAGIRISGSVIDIDDQPKNSIRDTTTTLFYHDSEPLANLINVINKNSQNLWAELVFRTLGAGKKGPGSHANSQAVIHSLLSRIGINPDWIDVADGSGLSRQNLMTPLQMITLLRFMYRHPDFQCFYESLPIAGVDGTMKDRLTGTAAAGNVRAKTGSLNRVKALSGYVTSKDQEDFVFSLMINNYTVPSSMATDAQDLICERLANFSRK